MNIHPKISVVTPSFNQAEYLEQTVQSVLGQRYPELEYIVMDGGSKDNSLEIIEKYRDQIAWFISEADKGQAEAINKGMAKANGDILAWLNSDDYYLPGTLERVGRFFNENPDVGLVYADVYAVDEKSEIFNLLRYESYGLADLMKFRIIGQPSVFFRRSVWIKTGGLDLDMHYLLDHHLWIKMAQITRITYVPETWSAARFHQTSKNVAYAIKFGKEAYRLVNWMEGEPSLQKVYQEQRKKILAGAHNLNGRYLSNGGMYCESLRSYRDGFFTDPGMIHNEWRRVLYTLLAVFGLRKIHPLYQQIRKHWFKYQGKRIRD